MTLQVEHKTEKGTVLFVKVPDGVRDFEIYKRNDGNTIFSYFVKSSCIPVELSGSNWKYIGLTSEVTEEQAKMMLPKPLERKTKFGIQYGYMLSPMDTEIYISVLDAWRSLMQFKKVYEVNPYNNPACDCLCEFDREGCPDECYRYINASGWVGTWLTLFKPNDL